MAMQQQQQHQNTMLAGGAPCDMTPNPYHLSNSPKQPTPTRPGVPALTHHGPFQPWSQPYYSSQQGGFSPFPEYHNSQSPYPRPSQFYTSQNSSRISETDPMVPPTSPYGPSGFSAPVKGHGQLIYA